MLSLPENIEIITREVVNKELASQDIQWSEIDELIIPESVTEIGEMAFMECGLTTLNLPNGLTKIADGAFRGCESLTTVTLHDGVTKIGDWAFSQCKSLTTVVLPYGITQIGDSAFRYCESLTSIVIPESVTEIGAGAFRGCIDLKTIYVLDMLADKGEDYWTQRGLYTDVTLMRHNEIKDWIKQQGLCIPNNIYKQAALYDWCQRQANPEQGPKEITLSKIPYADLIKLRRYHKDALLLKIPRTLNRLDDTNYRELSFFTKSNMALLSLMYNLMKNICSARQIKLSVIKMNVYDFARSLILVNKTLPPKLLEFLTLEDINKVIEAHMRPFHLPAGTQIIT